MASVGLYEYNPTQIQTLFTSSQSPTYPPSLNHHPLPYRRCPDLTPRLGSRKGAQSPHRVPSNVTQQRVARWDRDAVFWGCMSQGRVKGCMAFTLYEDGAGGS